MEKTIFMDKMCTHRFMGTSTTPDYVLLKIANIITKQCYKNINITKTLTLLQKKSLFKSKS